jgi:excisionase family DNA binding protein
MSLTANELDRLADAIADRVMGRMADASTGDLMGDIHDAAMWLGISVSSVERLVRKGVLPSRKIGHLRRFRRSDLLAFNMEVQS